MRVSENQRLILGPPGTGKTTYVLNEIESLIQKGVSPDRIAFVSFTKKAVTEATDRASDRFNLKKSQLPLFKTIHSLCFAGLGIGKKDVMGKENFRELGDWLGYNFEGTWDESEGVPVGSELGDTLLFLDNLARITNRPLKEIWEENYTLCEWDELERFQDCYQDFKTSHSLMDFTDMLYGYIAMCDSSNAQYVFVDEAQDLSPVQWMVLKHAFGNVIQTSIAGDDDQCQPAGTMVMTTKGAKPIEELDSESDRLLSYGDGTVYGLRNHGGYKFTKSARPYSGLMTTISAGGKTSSYTSNHKCLIKLAPMREGDSNRYVVYLMRKGTRYRVGMCKLRMNNTLYLTKRTGVEQADCAWILKVCETKDEASAYEHIYSARYGLPEICFSGTYPDLVIDKIFTEVDTEKNALLLLYDLGLDPKYPLVDKKNNPGMRYGNVATYLHACNLLPDIMCVPIFDGTSTIKEWAPISIERTFVLNQMVYSMDVEKYHLYIGDGILTHNSIYKWSGADVSAFLNLEGDRHVLSQSYRLPRAIHGLATNLVSRIDNRFDKPFHSRDADGVLDFFPSMDFTEINKEESTMILVRNTYLSGKTVEHLQRQGIPYINKGWSSLKKGHVSAILAAEKLRKKETISGAAAKDLYEAMRIGYYLKHGFKAKIGLVSDTEQLTYERLNQNYGLKDLAVWYTMLEGIPAPTVDYYRAVLSNGYGLTATPKCSISTIHAAKGGEAEHVILLSDMARRSYDEGVKSPDDERRVAYVGATRAKNKLSIIQPQSKYYFDYYNEGV